MYVLDDYILLFHLFSVFLKCKSQNQSTEYLQRTQYAMKQAHIAIRTLYVALLFDSMKSGVFILQMSSLTLSYHSLYTSTCTGAIQCNH